MHEDLEFAMYQSVRTDCTNWYVDESSPETSFAAAVFATDTPTVPSPASGALGVLYAAGDVAPGL